MKLKQWQKIDDKKMLGEIGFNLTEIGLEIWIIINNKPKRFEISLASFSDIKQMLGEYELDNTYARSMTVSAETDND